ncbi:hypothetical protein NFI96_015574, partial [Prochilodus magdalenae]
FVTVLDHKQVTTGEKVTLSCEVNITTVNVTWKKNEQKLECLEGKYQINLQGRKCSLEIQNVQEADEGNYTVEVTNRLGTVSCSCTVTVEHHYCTCIKMKRTIFLTLLFFPLCCYNTANFPTVGSIKKNLILSYLMYFCGSSEEMKETLRRFKISNKVSELRFLLHGPIGAGKSSIINTIKSVFERRLFFNSLVGEAGHSFTVTYQKFTVGSERSGIVPFAFYDLMGLEEGQNGIHTDDIIQAFKGHLPENYEFQPKHPIIKQHTDYIKDPSSNDKIHFLISILPADKIFLMKDEVIDKMKHFRLAVSNLGIPQMVFMTRVDLVCKMTKADVRKVYQSKKIKDKMQECVNRLGVPMNCIFPVKNYHEESRLDENINCLILDALTHIVNGANDYVERYTEKMNRGE